MGELRKAARPMLDVLLLARNGARGDKGEDPACVTANVAVAFRLGMPTAPAFFSKKGDTGELVVRVKPMGEPKEGRAAPVDAGPQEGDLGDHDPPAAAAEAAEVAQCTVGDRGPHPGGSGDKEAYGEDGYGDRGDMGTTPFSSGSGATGHKTSNTAAGTCLFQKKKCANAILKG